MSALFMFNFFLLIILGSNLHKNDLYYRVAILLISDTVKLTFQNRSFRSLNFK